MPPRTNGNAEAGHALAPDASIEAIAEAIRALVEAGGALPSERALAERLAVKRHRLRRALTRLRAEGELAPARPGRPRSGGAAGGEAMVRGTNPLEIIELRMLLEPALARLAALRASPFEIARIQRAATTPDDVPAGAADLAFHKAIAAGARNSLAFEFYALLRQVATDARLRVGAGRPACPKRLRQRDAEHRAIADAIAARDPEAAEEAMRAHLAAVQRLILQRLDPAAVTAA